MARAMDIDEVVARLGVKRETVYAYVSRGVLRSQRTRQGSTFDRDEVEALASRGRRRPLPGEGIDVVLASSVTTLADGVIQHRGTDLAELVDEPFEAVAELLWTGELRHARWPAPAGPSAAARAVLGAAPDAASPADRLRLAVASAAAADPFRHDLRPEAVVATARSLIAAVAAAGAPPSAARAAETSRSRPAAARASKDGGRAAVTGAGRGAVAARGPSVARQLLAALAPSAPSRWATVVDRALVVLADHELAASTLAARVAASTRADPYQVVLAGMAAVSGPLHGGANVAAHRLLLAAESGAEAAVADQMRAIGGLPGFGHPIHRSGDPRSAMLLDAVQPLGGRRWPLVETVMALAAERAPVAPNVDFALGAMAYVAGLPVGATEAVFALARSAGWLAHAMEEYGEAPLRFRPRARPR
jgi:citrate synthase